MDKIEITDWASFFSTMEHTVLHRSERYAETSLRFEEPGLVSGNMHSIVAGGTTLTDVRLTSVKPVQINDLGGQETAESVFVLKGDLESSFANIKTPLRFGQQNHSIQYNTNWEGKHIVHAPGFHTLTISYDPAYLHSMLQSAESGPLEEIGKRIERKENFLASPYSLHWNTRMAEVLQAIRHCAFQGTTKYIFIESKMMELFVLQMEHLHTAQQAAPKEAWSNADKEKLYAVKQYIEQTYLEPITLKDFTYKFGLNEFKLKKGFKHFFQTTVFGYIHQLRMCKAKALLADKQMTVSEVAFFIGYQNIGSFSAEFKKRFGYTPREVG